MANQAQFAADILTAVGGKENVQSVTHCMTRLRFILKDETLATDEALKAISGVISVVRAGGQVQIIIGTTVDKTYDEVCKIGGFAAQDTVDENPDGVKKKLTPGQIENNILGAISGSITPVLPMFIAAGIFKMIATLLGPKNLAILGADSNLYILCNLVSDASYYFLPFMVAFSASKKFNCSAVLTMIIVSVMVHPTMLGIVSAGEPFTVFGFPMRNTQTLTMMSTAQHWRQSEMRSQPSSWNSARLREPTFISWTPYRCAWRSISRYADSVIKTETTGLEISLCLSWLHISSTAAS